LKTRHLNDHADGCAQTSSAFADLRRHVGANADLSTHLLGSGPPRSNRDRSEPIHASLALHDADRAADMSIRGQVGTLPVGIRAGSARRAERIGDWRDRCSVVNAC
jgi:hypothetical protein